MDKTQILAWLRGTLQKSFGISQDQSRNGMTCQKLGLKREDLNELRQKLRGECNIVVPDGIIGDMEYMTLEGVADTLLGYVQQ